MAFCTGGCLSFCPRSCLSFGVRSCLPLYYSGVLNLWVWKGSGELAEGLVAALLEAQDHLAKWYRHLLTNKEDAMQVVWHQLKGDDLYLRMVVADIPPTPANSLAQWCRHQVGRVGTAGGLVAVPFHAAQQGLPSLHVKGYHVHPP